MDETNVPHLIPKKKKKKITNEFFKLFLVTDAIEAEIEIPDAEEAVHIPSHVLVR